MLEWYLELQQLRYEDRFSYIFETNKIGNSDIRIPSLVLPMLIESAVESSVRDRNKVAELYLSILPDEKTININVKYKVSHSGLKEVDCRESIAPWEDQLEILSDLKNYDIKK